MMAILSSLAFAAFALPAPHVAPRPTLLNIIRSWRVTASSELRPKLIEESATSDPDKDTYLLTAQNATATCTYGGPHDYTTATNDTATRVALYKVNITVDSLWTENAEIFNLSSPDGILPANSYLKVPQCIPSIRIHLRRVQGPGGEICSAVGTVTDEALDWDDGQCFLMTFVSKQI
ncbi:hypothetical protein CFD26_108449 [Aspergillus turcosus]|uniref:Ubiquitin 3 binding protein But2 C-terminal domain-containing protein n=1 Tax=Aspergillus turcosus TaxID=1245748 RepID=A0A3R7FX68_9EURO|nr:hypothetical protein CFD26_108449 [Aspergillus turcosus]